MLLPQRVLGLLGDHCQGIELSKQAVAVCTTRLSRVVDVSLQHFPGWHAERLLKRDNGLEHWNPVSICVDTCGFEQTVGVLAA